MSPKRARGDGSVIPRKDGRWVARLSVGGKRIERYANTEQEARQKLQELQRDHLLGRLATPTRLTLAEWVERWLEDAPLRPSTVATYRQVLAPVLERLGTQRLHKLTPATLTAAFATLRKQGMGPRRLQLAHGYLKTGLRRAVDLGILATNPMERVPRPSWTPGERRYWTVEETARFVRTCLASPTRWAPLFVLLATGGLRISEALGLQWGDVDLKARTLRVERALVWAQGKHVEMPPKTRAGRRVVHLPEPAVLALQKLPRPLDPAGPIFRTETGRPPRPENLRERLRELCAVAGVPRLNVHGLRHVAATVALALTGDVHAVQRRLGHAHPSVTVNVYGYPRQGDAEVARALESAFGGP